MIQDKNFCMSSYLMYRYIYDENKQFSVDKRYNLTDINFERMPVKNMDDLYSSLKAVVDRACSQGKVALALSGGIDSAILAKLVPEGTKAYTFRCKVPGVQVTDESAIAAKWAEAGKLDHEIIDIYWDDIVEAADICMKHKNGPIHSIEAQIYIAAKKAADAGIDYFIFGENADIIYGGMNGLLSKDWLFGEFVDRYSYVLPYKCLVNSEMPLDPFKEFEKDGHISGHDFINKYFRQESLGSYLNACETAGVTFVGPYSETYLDAPIDLDRIRSGDTKYIIRELFHHIYPNDSLPEKIPMPRPVNEWFADWEGPKREEFLPHCTDNMTGDQKWMVWCLERYLNMIDLEV